MSFNDRPIHLRKYTSICISQECQDDSVTVPVWITQSNLDGLQALIQFIAGVEGRGEGRVPGSFELTMFYRQLGSAISKANDEARKAANAAANKSEGEKNA